MADPTSNSPSPVERASSPSPVGQASRLSDPVEQASRLSPSPVGQASRLSPLSSRRIAVTGSRGFLGRYVTHALQSANAEVLPVPSSDYNLTEQADVRRLYRELKPSVLIHLAAACGGIGANVANPGRFLYENALMGLMLIEEARHAGLDRFVLISTTCAYPKDAPLPLREDSLWDGKPVGATGPYGVAKRLLHEACLNHHQQYGLDSVVLIPANLYGPGDHFAEEKSHVIPAMIKRFVDAADRDLPEVVNWGTGTPTREFLHARDAARAITLAAATGLPSSPTSSSGGTGVPPVTPPSTSSPGGTGVPPVSTPPTSPSGGTGVPPVSTGPTPSTPPGPSPINLGTGVETSIAELVELIARLTGYEGTLSWDTTKPDGQPRRYLDVSRARDRLGFASEISLEIGLAETIEWYRELSSHA